MQTGNETEYAMVVVALCVGAMYSLVRFIFKCVLLASAVEVVSQASAPRRLPFALRGSFFVSPIPLSPPVLALRI